MLCMRPLHIHHQLDVPVPGLKISTEYLFDFANVEPFPQNIVLSPGKNVVTEETFDFEVFGLKYVLIHLESIPIKIFN